MGKITYQGRDGALRIYDGSGTALVGGGSGTPYYIEIPFENMDFTGPAAKPRPIDPIVVTAGGFVHKPTSDEYERTFYEPLPFSFSCRVDDTINRVKLRDSLCNVDLKDPWTVGSNRWASTKGRGSIIMPDGTFQGTKAFFDVKKVSIDMQLLFKNAAASSSFGMNYEEIYTAPQEISVVETPDSIELQVRGLIYGDINAITAFSEGRSS